MSRSLLSAGLIALGCLLVFVLVLPGWDGVTAAQTALAERQALLQTRQDEQKNVTDLLQQYNSKRLAVANLGYLMPEKAQIDQIIVGLQAAAQASGLQTSEMGISSEPAQGAAYAKTALRLNVAGSYPALLQFLQTVEQSLRIYDVSEISIGKNSSGAGFSIEIKLTTYSTK